MRGQRIPCSTSELVAEARCNFFLKSSSTGKTNFDYCSEGCPVQGHQFHCDLRIPWQRRSSLIMDNISTLMKKGMRREGYISPWSDRSQLLRVQIEQFCRAKVLENRTCAGDTRLEVALFISKTMYTRQITNTDYLPLRLIPIHD